MSEETETPQSEGLIDELGGLLRELGANPNNPYRPASPAEVRIPRSLLILCLQTGAGAILGMAEDKGNQPKDPKEAASYALAGLGAIGILAVAKRLEVDPTVTTIRLVSQPGE